LYFFKIEMQDGNEGPAPITKTGLFSIRFLIFIIGVFLVITNLTIYMIECPSFLNNQNPSGYPDILIPNQQ